jgi:hypothetical protein
VTNVAGLIVGFSVLALVAIVIAIIWNFALDVVRKESPLEGCIAVIGASAVTLIIIFGPFVGPNP